MDPGPPGRPAARPARDLNHRTRTAAEPRYIATTITADLLCAAFDPERTAHGVLPHRLPVRARARCSERPPGRPGTGPDRPALSAASTARPAPRNRRCPTGTPDAATHGRIGERRAAPAFSGGGPFADRSVRPPFLQPVS
ncbi:hypothetical protein [Streptomyces carpinensis]|uniref:hypothetical protein n=1 Tax=Streptomyces carpinensis TaxID=66369 RepID=UPI000A3C29C4|nr:hypothetical protein [Streptomyces carpinensis]